LREMQLKLFVFVTDWGIISKSACPWISLIS